MKFKCEYVTFCHNSEFELDYIMNCLSTCFVLLILLSAKCSNRPVNFFFKFDAETEIYV